MGSRIRRWYSSARSAEFHRLLCCRHKNFSSIDWLTPLCKVKTNWNQIIIEYNESPFDHIAAAVIYFTGVKPDLSSVWKKNPFHSFYCVPIQNSYSLSQWYKKREKHKNISNWWVTNYQTWTFFRVTMSHWMLNSTTYKLRKNVERILHRF